MPFGDDAISVVTNGLRRSTGSFAERLVSHGLIGNISALGTLIRDLLSEFRIPFRR